MKIRPRSERTLVSVPSSTTMRLQSVATIRLKQPALQVFNEMPINLIHTRLLLEPTFGVHGSIDSTNSLSQRRSLTSLNTTNPSYCPILFLLEPN
ncbi:hypothetical protein GLYMA_18G250800v4 [Glycine max]|uniref:Uncharacterized protein n=1 Tax=Glycine max TaxID=3847 RepID=A0A0R0F493_SOYBN|nr:hypothetical protein JHK86_051407 [Glycine max]KAH1156087.1 hypothetical protein GYH30_051059 [Glycine max]KRH01054.1 hypothetical protein GLYMA_18G250800v4 [Glycine max]